MRICVVCKSSNCLQEKSVDGSDTYGHWYRYGNGWACRKCYRRNVEHVKNKDRINKAWNERSGPRRIWWTPEKRFVYAKEILRKNICSRCGKEGKTCIHHEQYHLDDPTKGIIELCVSCHAKHHYKIRH